MRGGREFFSISSLIKLNNFMKKKETYFPILRFVLYLKINIIFFIL